MSKKADGRSADSILDGSSSGCGPNGTPTGLPFYNVASASTGFVPLAPKCSLRPPSLRSSAPVYGGWPGWHGTPAGSSASGAMGFVPIRPGGAIGFVPIRPGIRPPAPVHWYGHHGGIIHQAPYGFAVAAPPSFAGGGAYLPDIAQIQYPAVVSPDGYYQSLLHGISSMGAAPSGQVIPSVLQSSSSGETGGQHASHLTGQDVSSPDEQVTYYTETDDDEEEVPAGDDEDEDWDDADDEEVTIESSDEDSEDDANAPVVEQQDETLQYEMKATAVGDCGFSGSSTKKRRRWPKGVELPDCRQARDTGTIEKAMRNSKNRKTPFIFEPALGMVFDSRAEAYQFYNLYSTSARNRVNKYRTMQELVCEKEGFDNRCTSSSKRNHCKAMIRLHRTEDHGWYVSKHIAEHNHQLSVSCGEKREWNSHSKIEQCVKDMIRYLRENNVSLSRVHCFMGSMYGSMQNVPFNRKSIRAVCAEIARDHKDDDVAKTLQVFRKMRAEDPGFQFSVDLDDQKRIKTLLWTSGRSRSQYNFFGDAITFDTTYCTNLYKMPFGMFVGVNSHFQSVLFAGVLMRDETAESFKWVFNEFITLMGGKAPMTILIDQCKAMTKAIREVLKNTTHLWCKWHIFKDAPQELGPVYRINGPFRRDFHYVINQMLTEDEFERAWAYLLDRYKLQDNKYMEKCYRKKKMWAKPWCKDIFCARMASTQRSESANSILKKVIPRNCSMNRFVEQYRKLLFIRASAEETAEHKTKQFEHRGNRVYAIEKHALSIYTQKAGKLFSAEVDKAAHYNVVQGDSHDEIKVVHYNENRKLWARDVFLVKIEKDEGKLKCECGLYEHFGILCCHAIKVLIHCGVKEIPEAHVMKRWTRAAKDFEYSSPTNYDPVGNHLQNSVLYVNALEVVQSAQKDTEAIEILMNHLSIAKKEIQHLLSERRKSTESVITSGYSSSCRSEDAESDYETDCSNGNMFGAAGSSAYMSDVEIQNIQAPAVRNTVGRPRQNRIPGMFERFKKGKKKSHVDDGGYCERCDEEGHTQNTCKLKPKTTRTKKKSPGTTARRNK